MPPDVDYGIWSLVPPVLAITLAIATRQVFLSLFAGIWVGYLVIAEGHPLLASVAALDACVAVFQDRGNASVILFSALVGSLIAGIQRSGGVDGFVRFAQHSRIVRGRRSAGALAMAVGMATFIESSIVCLVTGSVARPIFDRLRISREKLAYVCDTVSAPTCVMIPLNGWGAYVLAQIAASGLVDNPVPLLVSAIRFNFYAIISLVLLFIVLMTGWNIGPMRKAEERADREGKLLRDGAKPMITDEVLAMPPEPHVVPRAYNMILPIAVMVLTVPVGLYYTGVRALTAAGESPPYGFWEILEACSGSTSVFWAVSTAVVFAGLLYRVQGIMNVREYVDIALKGAAALVPLALLMVFAFAIGHLCRHELHTGDYVASVVGKGMPIWLVPAAVFAVSCFIAFSTGTSFGTFAIMLAIALPVADTLGVRMDLVVAAVLGGGVFGDHCSPISDTTIVSSMASASDHIDHVRTQLPYALLAGGIALGLYLVTGALM
jgi:Na+/H+ antiporter NhaC